MVLGGDGDIRNPAMGWLVHYGNQVEPVRPHWSAVRYGDVCGGRMDAPFDEEFLAGASPFPRSDYPRSG